MDYNGSKKLYNLVPLCSRLCNICIFHNITDNSAIRPEGILFSNPQNKGYGFKEMIA